jgi:hypothetical protein
MQGMAATNKEKEFAGYITVIASIVKQFRRMAGDYDGEPHPTTVKSKIEKIGTAVRLHQKALLERRKIKKRFQ